MSSKLGLKTKHNGKRAAGYASPSSHRFLIGPPLVVISLFCFGFVLIHPQSSKRPVSSRPSSTHSSRRKILPESPDSHIEKLNEEQSNPSSTSSTSSTNSPNQKNQPAGSTGNSSAHSDQAPTNDKNQQDESKNPITPLINKLTKQL